MPHSEIHGSKLIRSSPRLIAAYHVLLRLCMPRHPPNALTTLNRSHCQCSSFTGFGQLIPLACARRGDQIDYPDKPEFAEPETGLPFTTPPSHDAIDVFDRIALSELRRAAHLRPILRPASRDQIRDRAVRQRSSDVPSEIFFAHASFGPSVRAPRGRQTIGDGLAAYQCWINN